MSKYTTEIRWLVETGWNFGLKDYPIFDEAYRAGLNQKIIEHYYFREIGFETPALFNRFLNRKMAEIMPYYNQLYKSQLIEITPLTRMDYSEDYQRTADTKTSNQSTGLSDENSTAVHSDTPQGMLSIGDIENNTYASDAQISKASATTEGTATGTQNTTDNYIKKVMGNNAGRTDSEMLIQFRETFLNIDMQIIDDLSELFLNLY